MTGSAHDSVPATTPARITDLDAASAVLGQAFENYPWTRWTVDPVDPVDHVRRITALQRIALRHYGLAHGSVWVTTVDGHVRSVAVCMDSRVALRLDLSEPVARAVAEEVATLEGSRHEASIAAQVATEGLRPSTPHLYLATTGTAPELQRRGLATKTLLPMLAQADEERLDIFLETSTASNVAFYERLGFRIDGHVRIADGGPDVWGMLRSPVSPGG